MWICSRFDTYHIFFIYYIQLYKHKFKATPIGSAKWNLSPMKNSWLKSQVQITVSFFKSHKLGFKTYKRKFSIVIGISTPCYIQ